MEDKTCYVYSSDDRRPLKKRRVSSEFGSSVKIRLTTYRELWNEQEQLIQVRQNSHLINGLKC